MNILDQYFSVAEVGDILIFDMAGQAYFLDPDSTRELSPEFPTRAIVTEEIKFEHAVGIRPRDVPGQFEISEQYAQPKKPA